MKTKTTAKPAKHPLHRMGGERSPGRNEKSRNSEHEELSDAERFADTPPGQARTTQRKLKFARRGRPSTDMPSRFEPIFWADRDRRLQVVHRIEALVAQLEADTGADCVQKRLLCQNAAFLVIWMQTQQVKATHDPNYKFEAGSFVQSLNCLIGLLKSLGLNKVRAERTLKTYLAERGA